MQIDIDSALIMLHSCDLALETLGAGWTRKLITRRGGKRSDPEVYSPSGKRFRNFTQLRNFLERKCNTSVISQKTEIVLKNLFRIKSTECSVIRQRGERGGNKKVLTKPSLTPLNPIVQKKCKVILPKRSSVSPEEGLLLDDCLVPCHQTQSPSGPVIFISPLKYSSSTLQGPVSTVISESEKQKTTGDDCIYTDNFTNTEDLLMMHEKFEETETSIVASVNIVCSADNNVLVDSDMETVCENVKLRDSGEEIVGELYCGPGDKHFYLNNLIFFRDEDLQKENETNIPEDEETRTDEKHIDHNYIGKLTDLDLLDLYYNYDLKISDDMLDKFIEVTKHLYEKKDNEVELV